MTGYLILADGSYFEGTLFGYTKSEIGEIVFNTSMTGYQEIITDPSYYGQIVILTYPLIGNYGANDIDCQHEQSFVKGLVVRECNEHMAHWRSNKTFNDYLIEHQVMGIKDIDTRALTKKIRSIGTMNAVIVQTLEDYEWIVATLKDHTISNHVASVTTKVPYELGTHQIKYKVAVMDFGIKKNILKSLVDRGLEVKVFPAFATYEEVMAFEPDGLFLSNGPGDPDELTSVIEELKKFYNKVPIFGICLGHQLLSLALGGKTEKLKYGHRGGNHPVKDIAKDKVFITAQNHGYVVVEDSLNLDEIEVTHYNVNDDSIEGIKHKTMPIISVQYHPEASPGPLDSGYIFDEFVTLINQCKGE
ncbi:MAG: glutamine-hydrolyzing carbamoyl-phosphate synthase small subunit [Clostridia bacterium]|nr:glutamine-hydrolyzing carbamoyl-phosphate synthase small subunit [Clostridia bacterium]